ncbi:sodium/hydrogen exchanger [Chlorobaculum parvum NCIB 8327]|uniref:Sodium/hydrogen exchanger n=1 Tax=Chlorobaculum parvum (strain DSM 263 / NCIMB 8327) TaxID=517417 RepID=B3QNJ3_CHLP8|nr:cation:proton antiporter [Chlorobaculum parvum]ACF11496.1 sodium/hydrogen exchanger [Chlorobaculum parvum NCIB 8327]
MEHYYVELLQEFQLPLTNPVLIFSLVLFIILLSPIVLKRFNIPGTVGLILSGVLIGPYALNLLEKSSAVDLFSTIGLLYIMFIAGAELQVNELKRNRNQSLLFGLLTLIVPIVAVYPVCRYLLNYNVSASLLTASMLATHTLVAYPIVNRMGIAKNQAVPITVAGTILTDTAVLLLLAVIIGYSQGNLTQEFWLHLAISLTIFTMIVFIVLPFIARWFFTKLENEKHAHYIFVLSAVFFSAFLSRVAGLEPIVGAFAAGLALNRLIPNSSALMNRIEFIGNSLFIPFFLISVGMLVDLRVILSGPMTLIIAALLTVVALAGKWLPAWVTQKLFKLSAAQRQLIFGLSSSRAAATIAIVLVGYQARILDLNILNATIILILVTCIVGSMVTEKAAKEIVVEESQASPVDESDEASFSEQILLPIAEGLPSERVLEFAVLIREKRSAKPLILLSVVPNDHEAELNMKKSKKALEPMINYAASFDTKLDIVATIDYNVSSGISRMARELQADLVVYGWPLHRGFIARLINDSAESIVNCTSKTTIICQITQPLALHRRLVVIIPPLAEMEKGFEQWVAKMTLLSLELSIPMELHCNSKTHAAVLDSFDSMQSAPKLLFEPMKNARDWENLSRQRKRFKDDDIIVLVSARKDSLSYKPYFDQSPEQLEKHFGGISKIMIYPASYGAANIAEGYVDVVVPEPIRIGASAIRKVGNELGLFLKKNQQQIRKKIRDKRQNQQKTQDTTEKGDKP